MNYVVLSIEILVCLLILSLAILNVYRPKKWIKYSLVGVIIGIIISIMIVDVTIIDAIIYKVIEYLYFPPYEEYVLTIVLTVLILIFNILNSKIKNKYRIINISFATLILIYYVLFLQLGVDVLSCKQLYSGFSLIYLRFVTITATIWLVLYLIYKYYSSFVIRGDKKWVLSFYIWSF